MQLDQSPKTDDKGPAKNIGSAIAIASMSALGVATNGAVAKTELENWDFDTAVLYYAESDDRVVAAEPVFSATRTFSEGQTLNFKGAFDALTGASPNGATPSDEVQTFSGPSGNGQYDIDPNEQPLDDTFRDTRVALSTTWTAPLTNHWDYSTGLYASTEYDYLSLGLNGGLTRYFNQKNTTLNLGLSLGVDTIDAVGGTPQGLSQMTLASYEDEDSEDESDEDEEGYGGGGSETKNVVDALFGLTQVVSRNTIMQFNYGLSFSQGYLNDPYKIVSVIDDDPLGGNFGGNSQDIDGNNIYLYELRPDSRLKNSFYWQVKHARDNGDIVDASYRLMFDDWGINSHTLDLSYSWNLGNQYLSPHVRYYQQSEADFYQRFIRDSEYNGGDLSFTEVTSDYRLAELSSLTLGLKYLKKLKDGKHFDIRAEYYLQTHSGEQGFGKLAGQELYPDNDALMIKLGYSF